jgi:allantoicase
MGDGWETRRRRGPGFDWLILNSLDGKEIDKIEISTHHFKGNFPSHCSLQAAYIPNQKILKNCKFFSQMEIFIKRCKTIL